MSVRGTAAPLLALWLISMWPAELWACPSCSVSPGDRGESLLILVLLLVPLAAAGLGFWLIRRRLAGDEEEPCP